MRQQTKLAILVGGGPAPGINSVIGAATIRAALEGVEVLGIRDGFEWLMQGNIDHVRPLSIDDVSRIHFRGGSHIGIARANPTKDPALLATTVRLPRTPRRLAADHDRRRRHRLLRHEARGARPRPPAGGPRPENHRQRPRPPACTSTPSASRPRATVGVELVQEPDGRRRDHPALVLRHRDGPQGGTPRARHRQRGRRHHHAHPGGVRQGTGALSPPWSTFWPAPSSSV